MILLSAPPPGAGERSLDVLAAHCIEARLNQFAEEQRGREARLRVEIRILDDECGETLHATLVEAPGGEISAKAIAADHSLVTEHIQHLLEEKPF